MENLQGITILVMLLGIFSTIFWMVVSWRAMKAHEKLADAVERLTQRQASKPETESDPPQERQVGLMHFFRSPKFNYLLDNTLCLSVREDIKHITEEQKWMYKKFPKSREKYIRPNTLQ